MSLVHFSNGPYQTIVTSSHIAIQAPFKRESGDAGLHYLAEIDRDVDMAPYFIDINHLANAALLAGSWALYGALDEGHQFLIQMQQGAKYEIENPMNGLLIDRMGRALSGARGKGNDHG